jgi:hypothetical protein
MDHGGALPGTEHAGSTDLRQNRRINEHCGISDPSRGARRISSGRDAERRHQATEP